MLTAHPTRSSVAVLTPRGRAAVAVVSVRGAPEIMDADPPLFRAANGRPLAAQPIDRVCFGRWGDQPGEDVVVCRIAASLTEISCHGGVAAVERVVRDLEERGCRVAGWTDALRADHSAIAAECLHALTQAVTFRTAAILLEQGSGLLERSISALLEMPPHEMLRRLDELLRWAEFGRHLTQPWQVVLTGVPNVGKSSLINRLLGYTRSIVYAEPGTTRDVVTAATAFDGWPVELSDTAGLRDAAGEIETAGIELARQRLVAADLAIVVLDRSRMLSEAERALISELPGAVIVANKCDLASAWGDDAPAGAVAVSSLTGDGIEQLIARIASRLVPSVPSSGTAIPVTPRQAGGLQAARDAADAGDIETAREQLRRCLSGGRG